MFLRGLSEAYGFWNTICTRGRSALRAAAPACATSTPSMSSAPAVGASTIVTCRASVDLAAARFADDRERRARRQRERHAVERAHDGRRARRSRGAPRSAG